ncbi:LysR family transcriptional regulator [Halomonas denitrificans]|nr:LysR family transcriptional regulator [Halomonas denitrificans]
MNIEVLRAFHTTAIFANVSKAAAQLGTSQSVLSRKIKALEAELQVDLFHRAGNSIQLTHKGRRFFTTVDNILGELNQGLDSLRSADTGAAGSVMVAAPASLLEAHASLFQSLNASHPNIQLNLRSVSARDAGQMADADIMISNNLPTDQNLIARKVADEPAVFCATRDYLARHGTPSDPSQLRNHNCLTGGAALKPEADWLWRDANGQEQSVTVSGVITTDSMGVAKRMMLGGTGIACLPLGLVMDSAYDFEILFDGECYRPMSIYLVYPANKYMAQSVRVTIDHSLHYFEQLQARFGEALQARSSRT